MVHHIHFHGFFLIQFTRKISTNLNSAISLNSESEISDKSDWTNLLELNTLGSGDAFFITLILLGFLIFINQYSHRIENKEDKEEIITSKVKRLSVQVVTIIFLGAALSWVLNRKNITHVEFLIATFTCITLACGFMLILKSLLGRSRTEAVGLRDIRESDHMMGSMHSYDPLKFIDIEKGVFVGLENEIDGLDKTKESFTTFTAKPIYVPWLTFRQTHAQILGSTGSGKGISLGVLGYQFILKKEALIVFDPKGDARLPIILRDAAEKSCVQFVHLNLQADAPPQFNILEAATDIELEELLVAGLGLQPSSGDGNYYRGIDQDAAERTSKLAYSHKLISEITLPKLLNIALTDKKLVKADNFVRRLRQVCELKAIQTSHGIDIPKLIDTGSVIYVRGSTDNHRVKMLQTMLLIRFLQIVKNKFTQNIQREEKIPVCMILDEFKHLLSPVALDMLGVVREMGCHALLAHQSLADLAACPGLERKDVEPVVVDNATIKLIFRIGDDKAAEGFANKSGLQRVYKRNVSTSITSVADKTSLSEAQHPRISSDVFLHLHRPSESTEPYTAGVLFGLGLAKLFTLSPVIVDGALDQVICAPYETHSSQTDLEDFI